MKYVILTMLGILAVTLAMPSYIKVIGDSMYPTLRDRRSYRVIPKPFVRHFEHGDIAVVYVKGIIPYAKRVIAVGGDELAVTPYGRVSVNGEWLDEPYILPQSRRKGKAVKLKIPDNCYWVMGDNRGYSYDSRQFGAVERWQLLGKIIVKKRGKGNGKAV